MLKPRSVSYDSDYNSTECIFFVKQFSKSFYRLSAQLYEKLFPFERDLHDLGPGESVDPNVVLENNQPYVGHTQLDIFVRVVLRKKKFGVVLILRDSLGVTFALCNSTPYMSIRLA